MKTKIILLLTLGLFCLNADAQIYDWAKRIGGSDMSFIKNMKTDNVGNVFIAGSFRGTLDVDPGVGVTILTASSLSNNSDIFFGKYSPDGNLIWAKSLAGSSDSYTNEEATNIEVDASGNVYIAGLFRKFVDFDPGPGVATLTETYQPTANNVFLAKYDADGNYVWAKNFGMYQFTNDKVVLAIDPTGNLYVSGYFNGTADFDPSTSVASMTALGQDDIYLVKFDNSGNYLWAKQMGGGLFSTAAVFAIRQNSLGNVIIAGTFTNYMDFDPSPATATLMASDKNGFFAEYDSSGNYVRAKNIDGEKNIINDIVVDDADNICVAGMLWGTADFDPGIGVAEYTSAFASNFFAKYSASGDYIFANLLHGGGYDLAYKPCLSTDSFNNIYVAGEFTGTGDFDPGAGVANLSTPSSTYQIFFGKYDPSGNFMWVNQITGNGGFAYTIHLNQANQINLAGTFSATCDFDPGPAVSNLTNGGTFIAKYTSGTLTTATMGSQSLKLTVAPNPTTGTLHVTCAEKLINLQCTNSLGQQVFITFENNVADFAPLPLGIYFLKFTDFSGKTSVVKIVKR